MDRIRRLTRTIAWIIHSYHYISSIDDALFRREKISIILSPFIPVTWSKSTVPIETILILEVCLISSLLSGLKLIHGQTIHLQRKRIIKLFEASSKVYKTVWTFTVRLTCNCLQYFCLIDFIIQQKKNNSSLKQTFIDRTLTVDRHFDEFDQIGCLAWIIDSRDLGRHELLSG